MMTINTIAIIIIIIYIIIMIIIILGDMHSTKKVDHKIWFTYGGERSGRFQNLVNKDGSAKTECGIHTEISTENLNIKK